jgi:hypothetical protein
MLREVDQSLLLLWIPTKIQAANVELVSKDIVDNFTKTNGNNILCRVLFLHEFKKTKAR